MPAEIGERCGWCAYHVPEGAYICGACGAERVETEVECTTSDKVAHAITGGLFGLIIGFIIFLFNSNKPEIFIWCAGLCASLNVNLNKTKIAITWRGRVLDFV